MVGGLDDLILRRRRLRLRFHGVAMAQGHETAPVVIARQVENDGPQIRRRLLGIADPVGRAMKSDEGFLDEVLCCVAIIGEEPRQPYQGRSLFQEETGDERRGVRCVHGRRLGSRQGGVPIGHGEESGDEPSSPPLSPARHQQQSGSPVSSDPHRRDGSTGSPGSGRRRTSHPASPSARGWRPPIRPPPHWISRWATSR